MKKKIFGIAIIAFIAIAAGWNFNQSKNGVKASDLTLDNLEAIAQGRGNFPACQKNEGSGSDKGKIPFCVNGTCKEIEEVKGKLDVNNCPK